MKILLFYFLLGLSYLSPIFMQPWVSAFQDLCAFFALVLILFIQKNKISFYIDKKITWIFGIVFLTVLIQYLCRLMFFKQELVLSLNYISIFFLSIISGTNFGRSIKEIENLSVFFVITSLFCVILELIQWHGNYHSALILDIYSSRPFANMGQPNNLATLLFIGFFSNILLFKNSKLKTEFYIIISVALMTGIALTQSRTSWLVFIAILILSFFKRKLGIFSNLLKSSILFFCLVFILPYITLFFHNDGLTALERVGSDSSRLYIWKQMLIAIMDKPWFGYGWNQTSVAQTSVTIDYPLDMWLEYSHNLFLDLMVWNGIPIGLSIIAIITIWFFQAFRKINTQNQLLYFFIVTAFFIHCLLEFPFAYAYFLLPIGIYIGILHRELFDIKPMKNKVWLVVSIIFLSVSMVAITYDYFVLAQKRRVYASENLFSRKVTPITKKILLLDGLDVSNDILFLDDCYILKNYDIETIRNNYYRYPVRKNLMMYYKASIYYGKYRQNAKNHMAIKYPSFNKKINPYRSCSSS